MREYRQVMAFLHLLEAGCLGLAVCACMLLTGCVGPTSVSWRGVTYMTVQEATTDGSTSNMPGDMAGRVDAAKTTDVDTNVNRREPGVPETPPEPAVAPK